MAFNKNQHFVPKVHLRPFSLDGENLAISLINLRQMKPIPNAPVKNQCSSDSFYGRDPKLESAINFVENTYGEVVRDRKRVVSGKSVTVRVDRRGLLVIKKKKQKKNK